MKKAYLDHNSIVYFFGNPKTNVCQEASSLVEDNSNHITCSAWSLVEIANGNRQAEHLARALMQRNVLFIAPQMYLSEQEIKHFIFKYFLKINYTFSLNPFCTTIAQVHACYPLMANYGIPLDITPLSFVQELQRSPKVLQGIRDAAFKNAAAVRYLIQAEKDGTYIKFIKDEFFNYIFTKVPSRDLDGKFISITERKKFVDFCWGNKELFYQNCPSFLIEQHLFDYRRKSTNKKFDNSDILDMQHQATALPYCDFFITNDGFVISGNEYVQKQLSKIKIATTVRAKIVQEEKSL